jgi:hypothetical protein
VAVSMMMAVDIWSLFSRWHPARHGHTLIL